MTKTIEELQTDHDRTWTLYYNAQAEYDIILTNLIELGFTIRILGRKEEAVLRGTLFISSGSFQCLEEEGEGGVNADMKKWERRFK